MNQVIKRKVIKGIVIKISSDKTCKIRVARTMRHRIYKKMITMHKNYLIHDEKNQCKVGQIVQAIECAPYSKLKKFKLLV